MRVACVLNSTTSLFSPHPRQINATLQHSTAPTRLMTKRRLQIGDVSGKKRYC